MVHFFSLSVQNRRKSRVGSALENHLEAILLLHNIRYDRTKVTENKNKPDFLFLRTGIQRSRIPRHKSHDVSCQNNSKDRWRQVLAEAERIEDKHLLTLEPGISTPQTDEMKAKRLSLVLPKQIHESYSERQRPWLLDVSSFLKLVQARQPRLM